MMTTGELNNAYNSFCTNVNETVARELKWRKKDFEKRNKDFAPRSEYAQEEDLHGTMSKINESVELGVAEVCAAYNFFKHCAKEGLLAVDDLRNFLLMKDATEHSLKNKARSVNEQLKGLSNYKELEDPEPPDQKAALEMVNAFFD